MNDDREIAHSKTLDSETIDHILNRVGVDWLVPYYLQLVFSGLRELDSPLGNAQVDQVIESLLNPHHKNSLLAAEANR